MGVLSTPHRKKDHHVTKCYTGLDLAHGIIPIPLLWLRTELNVWMNKWSGNLSKRSWREKNYNEIRKDSKKIISSLLHTLVVESVQMRQCYNALIAVGCSLYLVVSATVRVASWYSFKSASVLGFGA